MVTPRALVNEHTARVGRNNMLQHITVDVHCNWSEVPPAYRIYVNNDLITERTFSWPGYQVYIRENITCDLAQGIHRIRIENCNTFGKLHIDNLIVEGRIDAEHPNYKDPELKQFTFIVNQ